MARIYSVIGDIFAVLTCTFSAVYAQPGPGANAAAQAEAQAQTAAAQAKVHAYLNEIGYVMLAKRADAVAAIRIKASLFPIA